MDPKKTLTLACATYKEPQLWATLEALHAFHPHCSYLVVNNAPDEDVLCRNTCAAIGGDWYHRPDLHGTSAPRDACFRLAKTPWVVVMDAHVLLEPGAVQSFLAWIEQNPQSNDLLTGPMIGDDGHAMYTHWRVEDSAKPGYWGVFDAAWQAPKGQAFCIWLVNGQPSFRDLSGNEISPPAEVDPRDPARSGCVLGGHSPFDIPAQGLGLFAMRKAAWPGFHPRFRGFGGEEGYIHEKVRRAGGRCLCLPALRWRHCFRNLGTAQGAIPPAYPNTVNDHAFNLLVGHRELGIEASEQIYNHFGKRLQTPQEWPTLVAEAERVQPFGKKHERKRLKILGVWYTSNAAPVKLMQASLQSIARAKSQTMHHDVIVTTAAWEAIPGNPFPCAVGKVGQPGHANIIANIRKCIKQADSVGYQWDAICTMEHDAIYPCGYFDKMGDALATGAPVVANDDYIGLNRTGYLKVKELHQPLYQIAMRRDVALTNLNRAEEDCRRHGWCLLEPDSVSIEKDAPQVMPDRSHWLRLPPVGLMPTVHVNW